MSSSVLLIAYGLPAPEYPMYWYCDNLPFPCWSVPQNNPLYPEYRTWSCCSLSQKYLRPEPQHISRRPFLRHRSVRSAAGLSGVRIVCVSLGAAACIVPVICVVLLFRCVLEINVPVIGFAVHLFQFRHRNRNGLCRSDNVIVRVLRIYGEHNAVIISEILIDLFLDLKSGRSESPCIHSHHQGRICGRLSDSTTLSVKDSLFTQSYWSVREYGLFITQW